MNRILRYFRGRRHARELRAEMESHLDEKAEELMGRGASAADARAAAARCFGNCTVLLERSRDQWASRAIDELGQDLRYAARGLRRNPTFSLMTIGSLALGIAANTVIFSVVNHLLLRALPWRDAGRLYAVDSRSAAHGPEPMQVSPADFYDWRAQVHSFSSLSAYSAWPMNLTNVNEPQRLNAELVSANLFATLGADAAMGRVFLPGEDDEQSPSVVVISDRLWRQLGASPQIIGRSLTLNGSAATVVGVMPPQFAFPSSETEAWIPLSLSAKNRADREGRWLRVIGRLKTGVTVDEARAELEVISHRLAAAYPKTNSGWSAALTGLRQEITGAVRPVLLTLQAGALLLLVIACVNIANLLYAKGASREKEMGMRVALGAGRARIVRQLMVESMLLAALGGGIGLGAAFEGVALVRRFAAGLLPLADGLRLSAAAIVFALAVAFITALFFGLAPAIHCARGDVHAQVGSGARGTAAGARRKRGALIAVETGLATVLLMGAGLLGRTLVRVLATSPGLQTEHVLTMQLTLAHAAYSTNQAQNDFFQRLLARVQALPGVIAAAESSDTPLAGNNPTFKFALEGASPTAADAPLQAGLRAVSAGYAQAAGIPLMRGRDLTEHDDARSTPVALVNESMARRCWPGENPIGKRVRLLEDRRWISVAGVVADIKHLGLTANEGPVIYIPYAQKTQDWLAWTTLLVRTAGDPQSMGPTIRAVVHGLDKNQPIGEVGTLAEIVAQSTAMPRVTASAAAVFSGFALAIAVIGVYGLLAYDVARRTSELGIRVALGATPAEVLWLLLRDAMTRVVMGLGAGLVGAWFLAGLLEHLLFGVRPHDAMTFAGVVCVLLLASLAAVLMPARRAMRLDAANALRIE